ncbi:MAG: hypothetical protein JWQ04_507, partial [Pedosphaera sp.]|nr:hypothetical protein [Pedosphaera sp.]
MNRNWLTMMLKPPFSTLCVLFLAALAHAETTYVPVTIDPPAVRREFRGAWIATVGNIDWPSKPGLPVQQQKDELLELLDRAAKLNLNAVVLQVRPACDALYASKLEPWSYYLTGTMGKPPEPYYDPLAFAVEEAHKRGLELHAWFNPYRAALLGHKYVIAKNHISHTHPEMVVKYGSYLWLDPGEKEVQEYSLRVVMDVVKRYDIDAVHFDDYFYPYKEQDAQKQDLDFPDWGSWKKYHTTGTLSRNDWRRENVNVFVKRVYDSIKAAKPWVKVGISPFGFWQPGYPQQIKGFNAYEVLYCDSRKWLTNGWLDYCSPQLYWGIDPPDQSFPVLLKWWLDQNPKHRNIWPGLDSENVGGKWKPEEIVNQVKLTREMTGGGAGTVHWNVKGLGKQHGLGATLAMGVYAEPALIP